MARTQRVRFAPAKTPSRNDIRNTLAEFNETEQSFLVQRQASAPIGGPQALPGFTNDEGVVILQPDPLVAARVEQDVNGIRAYDANDVAILNVDASNGTILAKGNITGGSVTLDDTAANSTYWYMADNVGLTSRVSDTDTQISQLRSSYDEPAADIHQRNWILSVHDVGAPYGTNVGREAFVQVFNTKHEGSESAASIDNRAMVLLRAKVNSSAQEVAAYVEAKNDGTVFQVQGADYISLLPTVDGLVTISQQLQITGTPFHQQDPLAVSNYADGTKGWYAESESNSNAFGGTAIVVLGPLQEIPVIGGRQYRVTFYARTLSVPVSADEITITIERSVDGVNWAVIQDGKWQPNAANANPGGITVVAKYDPAASTNVDFRVRAQRTSGSGSSNVLGATSTSPMYLLVEGIGW